MNMIWCPKCKSGADYEGKYCSECGTQRIARPKCSCGKPLYFGQNFCTGCGGAIPKVVKAVLGE